MVSTYLLLVLLLLNSVLLVNRPVSLAQDLHSALSVLLVSLSVLLENASRVPLAVSSVN